MIECLSNLFPDYLANKIEDELKLYLDELIDTPIYFYYGDKLQ